MNWDDIKIFLTVAELGNLSRASRALNVDHSTVFRRINQFEKSLAVRLFNRLKDGYQLTQAGEEMLPYAREMQTSVNQIELTVVGKDVRPSGLIRVTAPDTLAYYFISQYMAEFTKLHPMINIELTVSNQDLDFTRRETDIAIRATSKTPSPYLIGKKIFSVPWAFYASKKYIKKHGQPHAMQDLQSHHFIGPDGLVSQLPAYRILEEIIRRDYRVRGNTLFCISSLAQTGQGIALLPDDHVYSDMERLFTMEPLITSDIWLLTHPELRANERIRLFISFLFACFRQEKKLKNLVILD